MDSTFLRGTSGAGAPAKAGIGACRVAGARGRGVPTATPASSRWWATAAASWQVAARLRPSRRPR
eukprot:251223-Lingulodinium_polyedra.AAC.1